jgi:hypothetical protein
MCQITLKIQNHPTIISLQFNIITKFNINCTIKKYIEQKKNKNVRNIKRITILLMAIFAFCYIINDQNNSLISFAQNAHNEKKNTNATIPSYAVDQYGKKNGKFPLYSFTNDKKFETGISWVPPSIKTNEPITFIMDFFSYPQNEPLHLWPYNFVLIQNGKEIYRTSGITQLGSSTEKYIFNSPGSVIIKLESSQDTRSFSQYGTVVYKNPNSTSFSNINNVQNKSSPLILGLISYYFLNYAMYIFIIVIVILLVILVAYIRKSRVKDIY